MFNHKCKQYNLLNPFHVNQSLFWEKEYFYFWQSLFRNRNKLKIIMIICDIYIALIQLDTCCSKALYSIIIPDSDLFPPSTNLNSKGSIHCMLPLKAQSVTHTHSHRILSGTHCLWKGWTSRHMTALQLTEPRSCDPLATSPTL